MRLTAVSQVQAANAEKELNQQAERALEETARSASHEVEDANMAKEVCIAHYSLQLALFAMVGG